MGSNGAALGRSITRCSISARPSWQTGGFNPGSVGNFYTANTTLLLTSRISDKASVLSEVEFEEEEAQAYGVSFERILLKHDYDDHLKISFGRYHTGIGYYNTAFHSGAWLQTADRPLIMEFAHDGGLLPTQAIGVSITGSVPSGKAGVHYIAEYGYQRYQSSRHYRIAPDGQPGALPSSRPPSRNANWWLLLPRRSQQF
jgi:hypothetical protein